MVLNNLLDPLLVAFSVLLEEVVGVRLGGRFRVRIIEEILNTKEDLLDCDGGLPALLLIQYR